MIYNRKPVILALAINIVFPATRCCNCGSTMGLRTREQDTRAAQLTTSFPISLEKQFGFRFTLPVCPGCEITLERPPLRLDEGVLVYLTTTLTLVLIGFLISSLRAGLSLDLGFSWSAVVALVLVATFYLMRRTLGDQTTYYQPVRVTKFEQNGYVPIVTQMSVAFTNYDYRDDFRDANRAVIDSGAVTVSSV